MVKIIQIEVIYPNKTQVVKVGKHCKEIFTNDATKTATIVYDDVYHAILVNVPFILLYQS